MVVALKLKQVGSLSRVAQAQWEALDTGGNPFLNYHFLNGLERCGCLDGHGWQPCHLLVTRGDELLGAMPLYLRDNSQGEFVFDWAWAEAFQRAGGSYYPKLVTAIPFTPVCGPRLLTRATVADTPDTVKTLLVKSAVALAERAGLSSFHSLFTMQDERSPMEDNGLLLRNTCQFHWHNRDYENFDDFLQSLNAKRRKQIRRERRLVREQNIDITRVCGADISAAQWEIFYQCYCNTFLSRWGSPRLTLDFFQHLGAALPDNTLLILARQGQEYVAGAFAMLDETTLYGRHWGCTRHLDCLHFELCYYQTIEYCLEQGLRTVNAGVQGEHKLYRGFEPQLAVSGHWIRHQGLRTAVDDFLQRETPQLQTYVKTLQEHAPFVRDRRGG